MLLFCYFVSALLMLVVSSLMR